MVRQITESIVTIHTKSSQDPHVEIAESSSDLGQEGLASNSCLSVTRNVKHNKWVCTLLGSEVVLTRSSNAQSFSSGLTVKSLVGRGLSQELESILHDDMGITKLTAVQAAVIPECLMNARGANGVPLLPNFHLATGIGKYLRLIHHQLIMTDWVRDWEELSLCYSDR